MSEAPPNPAVPAAIPTPDAPPENEATENPSSYSQIMRSSSILGGAQVLTYLIAIARTKAAAVLLGTSGVGTLSLFQSTITLVGTISSLGIAHSGVREIAVADGTGDRRQIAHTSGILHRIALLTGLGGWLLAVLLAYPLSRISFGDGSQFTAIALLGSTLLFAAVGTSIAAILQGTRRISTLAKFQVATNLIGSLLAIALYAAYGAAGIVPSLIVTAAVNFGIVLWIQKRLGLEIDRVSWKTALLGSKALIVMGLAFMWNAATTAAVTFGARAMVSHYDGLDANGIYQAAWAISGMFAGFILQAMGTDFYPRLTAASSDLPAMNRMINEQTEIGVLLAGPGVLGTLCLAPFLMKLLYSSSFEAGTPMICWFALGVFGQVISWPLGFIQIARGASRAFVVTQTLYNGLHFGLIALFFRGFGLQGIAIAYAVLYVIYTSAMLLYARSFNGFRWTPGVLRLIAFIGGLVAVGFLLAIFRTGIASTAASFVLAAGGGYFCLRELLQRLPSSHRLARLLGKFPGLRPA